MKRVYLYDKCGKMIFSGSLCDLPLDGEKVREEAKRVYGERLCPDRLKNIKTQFISRVTSGDGILDENSVSLLEYKNAYRFVIDD